MGLATEDLTQSDKSFLRNILIQIQWIHFPKTFRGNAHLSSQERNDGLACEIQLGPAILSDFGVRVHPAGQGAIQPARELPPDARWPEVASDNPQGFIRTHFGIKRIRPARQADFHNRGLVAHPDTADAFDGHVYGQILRGPAQRMKQGVAALGHAAGAQTHANLALAAVVPEMLNQVHIRDGAVPGGEKIIHHCTDGGGRKLTISGLINLHGGCQRAAPQTGDPFHGEDFVRRRIAAFRDLQLAEDGVMDIFRAFHMARGAMADTQGMPPGLAQPELVIKRGHPNQVGQSEAGQLADALQGGFREIPVFTLQALENRDGGLATATGTGEQSLQKPVGGFRCQVNFEWFILGHVNGAVIQCRTPRWNWVARATCPSRWATGPTEWRGDWPWNQPSGKVRTPPFRSDRRVAGRDRRVACATQRKDGRFLGFRVNSGGNHEKYLA